MVKIIGSFKNQILNKSNQYLYYKSQHALLKKRVEDLETNLSKQEGNNQNLVKKIGALEGEILERENELKVLNTELDKIRTVPKFENLNKTLKGKDDYLFLINDGNEEIRQHFDRAYVNQFKKSVFIENLNNKEGCCETNNIKYYFFIVPDKSYVCRDLLPFDVKLVKRNYDQVKDLVPDFSDKLDPSCYWKNDTHINFVGGTELTYNILHYIDKNFTRDEFDRLINEQIVVKDEIPHGDLMTPINWSYSEEEKEKYNYAKDKFLYNKFIKDLRGTLPEQFKYDARRETVYTMNENSLTDLRVLIFRDSSTNYLYSLLSMYFKEMLLYWDHWILNKEIIEWYKPDIVFEIRTERFLDRMTIH